MECHSFLLCGGPWRPPWRPLEASTVLARTGRFRLIVVSIERKFEADVSQIKALMWVHHVLVLEHLQAAELPVNFSYSCLIPTVMDNR
jgi:hypothetical protein